jgi:hypothetical protein
MTDKSAKPAKSKAGYMCEVCRCKVSQVDADKTDYLHCGRKMTPMEVIYMSDPSPSGP